MMKRFAWWWVDRASALLEPIEREATRGDIAEAQESAAQALRDVAGLVVRRQFGLWKNWRPWLVLAALIPCSLRLTLECRQLAHITSIYAWMYFNNWTPTYVGNGAERQDLAHYAGNFLIGAFTLLCFSWGSGLALGFLSRRAIAVNGLMFCTISVLADLAVVMRPQDAHMMPAFSLAFYRVVVPVIFETALLLVPAVWGMNQGLRLADENT